MTFEIEDYMNEFDMFINSISGKSAHSDSYMTILDYNKLIECYNSGKYTDEQWLEAADYWITNTTRIPPLYLAAKELQRQIKKKNGN